MIAGFDQPTPSMSSEFPAQPSPHASLENRFGALFEQAPVSIQILAADGRTLRVNHAWEELWQIRAGSALMAHVFSADYNVLTDPQLVAGGITPYLRRAFAGESVAIPAVRYDVAALGGTGPARWVTARAHPLQDSAGNIVEVMLMHEDITERVAAETALRVREERFRSLVMATSQIVWTNTPDGRVLEDSPSWRAFTGQTYEEWKESGWLDALHPDDRAPTAALWQACVAQRAVFETRYRLRRADGTYRWTAVKGLPIVDAGGGVREWIGANTDIHDTVLAQAELQEQDRRKDEFLAMLAHELRNPLAPISAAADMLRSGAADPAAVRRTSEVIGRQVRHMTSLVDDLLDVARVTRGLIQLDNERVAMADVVAGAVEQARPTIEARAHALAVTGDAAGAWVLGDRHRLVQVLVNLLNNAAKYTSRGGAITLALTQAARTVSIDVRDNGIGIDAELLPHVFDLFTQAERSPDRAQGGLGIGLALVRHIVTMHGGTVAVQSAGLGCGCVFTVTLPVLDA
ncbi:sensor histidine kinase [Pseudoduganella chitinolytica]|uniref:histidine kinase n=1 Tax=Pseudoduganella chitinolytica TaxID=34070 RepID=A0ABY8BCR4_9BURK|nr:ATP-binding protein [Pseudoduganella chitinolytica]WEF33692.1 PAS domain S-box protein [Pseudoduganella chitinolytica]